MKATTQKEFIDRVTKIFPEYDFSKAIYKGCYEKVLVGCKHGYWWERPVDLYCGHTSCEYCIREKVQNTNLKKFGVNYPAQSPEIKEKIKQSNLKKYGVENPSSLPEIREKFINTCLERYGGINPMSSPEIQEKALQTNLDRFGIEYPNQFNIINFFSSPLKLRGGFLFLDINIEKTLYY